MAEERAEERGAARHLGALRHNAVGQTFALLPRPAGVARAFRMAPGQLIGVEIRGVAGQVMHGQRAVELRHVVLDRARLVGRQSVQHQMQGLAASAQHPAQQRHEQRADQGPCIGGEPEGALGTDGRRGADVLVLAGNRHDWRLSLGSPRHAVHRIGAKARLVPEIDLALVPLGGACDRGVGLALVGALHGFLRDQTLSSQQRADRGRAHAHTESLADQFSHAVPRPHPEVESILPGGLAVDPAKHLPLLRGLEPAIDLPSVKAVAGDHLARAFALTHALDRHRANGLQCRVIQCPPVSRHSGTDHHTIITCYRYRSIQIPACVTLAGCGRWTVR